MRNTTRLGVLLGGTGAALAISASPALAWSCPGTDTPCAPSEEAFEQGGCTTACPTASPSVTVAPSTSAATTTVPAASTAPPTLGPATHTELPHTGSPTGLLLLVGGTLLVGGAAGTAIARRGSHR